MTTVRRRGSEIRALILEAAGTCFAEGGYHGTTTREIAATADVSERLIYLHFESKANLFEQAVAEPFAAFMEAFVESWRAVANEDHSYEEIAGRWIGGVYDLLRQHRALVAALLSAAAYDDDLANAFGGKDSPLARFHRHAEEIMAAEATRSGLTGRDLRVTVRLPFAMLLATAVFDGPVFAGIGRRPGRDVIVAELTALAVYGTAGLKPDRG